MFSQGLGTRARKQNTRPHPAVLLFAQVEDRPAVPSFKEGAITQMVADGVIKSSETKTWVDVDYSAFQPAA